MVVRAAHIEGEGGLLGEHVVDVHALNVDDICCVVERGHGEVVRVVRRMVEIWWIHGFVLGGCVRF